HTGEFTIAGGYSTSDGVIGEVSIGERNLLGTGLVARASVRYGQYTKGFELAVTEPYVLGSRLSAGVSPVAKQTVSNTNQSFGNESYGGTLTLGTPLTEELGAQFRYSLYRQRISLAPALMDCSPDNPPPGCYANGEASVPVKQAVLNGPAWVS